jgi:hypothetical protein
MPKPEEMDAAVESWIWGLALVALTVAIHAAGVAAMALATESVRIRIEGFHLELRHVFAIFVILVTVVALLLALLHGIEAELWAVTYYRLHALDSPGDAILYSVDSLTTRGASGLDLQKRWRMMGALEAAEGVLLFGVSTAFVFAVMQAYWPLITARHPSR